MSSSSAANLMAGYLLGELFEDERRRLDGALATGATAPDEAAALAAVHSVALYTIPTKPSPRVRDNLLASLTGRLRLLPFRDRIAAFLDVDADTATTVLTTVDHRVGWVEEEPEVRARTVLVGPSLRDRSAHLIRAGAGAVLPRPSPATTSRLLVLQGRLRDDDGALIGPGAIGERPPGRRYRPEVQGRDEVIVLVLTRETPADEP